MNEYFENPEQVRKVPKSCPIKKFQKIWLAKIFSKNYSDYGKISMLVQGVNADVYHHFLMVCGDDGSTPASA